MAGRRIILMTTSGGERLDQFRFAATDCLLMGRESAGAPEDIHRAADARVRIPLAEGVRSLNVAVAAGLALWEGLRQTGGLPGNAPA